MLIDRLRERYDAACAELESARSAYDKLPATADAARVEAAKARLDGALADADAHREALEHEEAALASRNRHKLIPLASGGHARISIDEPDLYTRDGRSFIHDLYAAQLKHDPAATERITRHQLFETEKYAFSGIGSGTLGGILPPQYLVDLYAKAPRYGRVFADQVRHVDLFAEGMVAIVPQLTQGTDAGVQANEGDTATTRNLAEDDLSVPVRTVTGYVPVSRQTLERASYSEPIIMEDLIARYQQALDVQALFGLGSGGAHLGLLKTSGITAVTYDDASPTVQELWPKLAGLVGSANLWAATVGAPADKWIMTPTRWAWFTAALDTTGRPLFGINGQENYAPQAVGDASGYGFVGRLLGLPVYTDANVPTDLKGDGSNEDPLILLNSQAVLLWETPDGTPITLAFEQTAGNSLVVELIAYGYSAFTAARYPAASGYVAGTGTATPGF